MSAARFTLHSTLQTFVKTVRLLHPNLVSIEKLLNSVEVVCDRGTPLDRRLLSRECRRPCICPSVCPVRALTFDSFNLQTPLLVSG